MMTLNIKSYELVIEKISANFPLGKHFVFTFGEYVFSFVKFSNSFDASSPSNYHSLLPFHMLK